MIANNESIIATFGLAIDSLVESKKIETKELVPTGSPTPEQILQDFNTSRKNVLDVIDTTRDAMSDLANIAAQSQDDKYYDSLSSIVKVMLEANRDLIDIHMKIQKLGDEVKGLSTKVQNNLFVGSTAELTKFLEELKKKD